MKLHCKRATAVLLALVMMLALVPATVFAAAVEPGPDNLDGLFTELPEGWSFTSRVGSIGYDTGKEGGEWKKSDFTHNGNTVYESISELPETPNQASASWLTPSDTSKEYYVSFEYAFLKGADSAAEFSFGQSYSYRLTSLSNTGTPLEGISDPTELESVTWQTANITVPATRGIGLLHKLNGAAGGSEKVYVSNFKVYDEVPQEWKATVQVTVTTDHLDLSGFTYVSGGNGNIQIKEETQCPITLETTLDKTVTVGQVKLKENVEFIKWETDIPEGEWTATDSSGFSWKVSKGGTYSITLHTVKHAPAALPGNIQLLKQEGDAWNPVQIKGSGNQTVTTLPTDAFSNYWWYDWSYGTVDGQKLRLQYSGTAENTEVRLYDDENPVEVQSVEDGSFYYEIAPNDTEHLLKMVVTSSEEGSVPSTVTVFLWPTMTWDEAFGTDTDGVKKINNLDNDYLSSTWMDGSTVKTRNWKPDVVSRGADAEWNSHAECMTFDFNPTPPTITIDGDDYDIKDENHQIVFTSAALEGGAGFVSREITFTAKTPGTLMYDFLVYTPEDKRIQISNYYKMGSDSEKRDDLLPDEPNSDVTRQNIAWTTHSFTIEEAGETYRIAVTDPDNGGGFMAISNLKFLSEKKNITFHKDGEGDGTITGAQDGDFYVGQNLELTATPNDTSVFLGWYDGDNNLLTLSTIYSFQIESSTPTTIKAKFGPKASNVAQIGTTLYSSLDEALKTAETNPGPEDKTVKVVAKDLRITEDTTIPAGVTVVLPCSASDMGYLVGDGINHSPDGTVLNPATGAKPTTYCTLTVADGKTLTIQGTLLVNAEVGRPGGGHYDQDVNGGCAVVQLSPNSKIVVESGGLLDVFGYVRGTGTVTVKTGGTASDLYVVRNWRGGSQAFAIYPIVYPMNQEDMHNIEVETVIESGGRLEGSVRMYAGGYFNYTRFPQIDGTNGLIRGGKVTKTLVPKDQTEKKVDDREKIVLEGNGSISYSALMIVGLEMSTGDFLFPIDGDMDFEVNGTWNITDQLKFMPGAIVTLKDGAKVTIAAETQRSQDKHAQKPAEQIKGNNVVFYDTTFQDNMSVSVKDTNYPTTQRGDAKLVMEGGTTLTANGAFAGKIEIAESATEEHPATVTFNGGVSVTSPEANDYCKLIDGSTNPTPRRELTFKATIDGYEVQSGKTYTCWKEGETTVIKVAEDGNATNSVDYNGAAQKWADDGASYEYKSAAEGGTWTGEAKNAGTYSVRKVTQGTGYKLVEVLGTLTIEPVVAEFELDGTSTFPYDGLAHTVTAKVTNKISDDDVTVTLSGYTGTDAQTYTATVTSLGGEAAKNYTIGDNKTLSWEITKAQLTLTWDTRTTFTYDKQTHTVSATLSGQQNDEDVTVTLSENTYTDAGTYQAKATINYGDGTKASNYTEPANLTQEWSITQAEAPTFDFPTVTQEVTYKPDGKLEDVELSFTSNEYGTFAWTDGNIKPTVTQKTYSVTFTPSAETIQNYKDIPTKTQMVTIDVQKGEQAAPEGVAAHDEQTIPGNDGYITGVDETMEWKKADAGDNAWQAVTGTQINNLAAGSYNVRYKANDNQNAGTPTKVTVNKYNPTAEAQPTASIDYKAEELTGLAAGDYKINGTTDVTVDETGKIKIHEDWIGQTISIVKKGDGTHTVDSNALMLDIPARPDAPTDLKGGYTSKPDAADGKVTGLDGTAAYEYSTDGTAWNKLTGETKLAKGTYQVRLAATDKDFHSETAQVEVKDPTVEVVPEISIDYGAEKLTGFESGTYTVNGTQITVTDNKADINPDWFGTTVKIVKKGTYPTSIDSAEKKLAIPARPAAPSVTMERISEAGQSDGGITVTNPAQGMTYEYRKGTDGQWTDMVNAAADGLSEDTYYVRVKAGADHFAGNTAEVKVTHKGSQEAPELTVTSPEAIGQTGSVKGLTTAMEWSEEQNGTYTQFTEGKIAELEAIEGDLHLWVRMAETETLAHSEAVEITVTAFVPTVMETPTDIAIDYAKEQLTGLTEGSYRITVDGEDTTVTVTGTVFDIQDGWFGKEIKIVKAGDQIVSVDGETVTVTVPARPDAPEGLEGKTPTSSVGTDGSITGLDGETAYEYKAADGEWQDVEAGKETIEGLAVGFYDVRIKATEEAFASESVRVEVKEYVAPPIPVIPPDTTETVTNPDGSTTTTTTEADGTKTETTTQTDGTVTEKVTEPDGSAVETTTTPEGVTGQVTTDAQGEITSAEVVIPEARDDEVVTAPVEVPAAKSAEEAPEISVKTGSEDTTKVEIPVTEVGPGTVAVVVHEDGTEEVVRDCVISENGVVLNVEGDVTLKIVDNTQTFKDVEPVDHWATDEVEFVAARELFNGKEENMFDPDGDMTRGMLVTVLHRLAYEPDAVKTSFGDVNANEYYAEAVSWAAGLGVVNGKGENSFAPEEDITREDLAVILYRYAEKMGYDLTQNGTYSSFADAGDISGYAREAMDWAVSVGLIAGKENGRLAPQENATRAQVAAIFMRFCKNVIK